MSTYRVPHLFDTEHTDAFRADRQGDLTDQERAERALINFVKDIDFTTATYLEGCIHCGLCAEACHFHEMTGNPIYTPIWKLELFKQAYKREASPLSFVYKALNLKRKVTAQELEQWQHLIYDSCTICGRCSMICPMGIDIASLILKARHAMYHAGLVPEDLWNMARKQEVEGSPMGVTAETLNEIISNVQSTHNVQIPIDQKGVDVMITASSTELLKYPDTLADMARVIEHMGYSWTLSTTGFEASNYGMLAGNETWQRNMSMKLIEAAIACQAKIVVVPECEHAYGALRWEAAELDGNPLPFKVMHMTEFMADGLDNGKLRLGTATESITFHDPCQVSRRGGATEAPRKLMSALGVDLHEMPVSGDMNWCCGGGGGVFSIGRAQDLRYRAFEIKMDQVKDSGAEQLYTSCSDCRMNIDDASEHFDWDKQAKSLLGLVACNLA